MPSVLKRLLPALAGSVLVIALLPAPGNALPAMRSVEATRWGLLMAGTLDDNPVTDTAPRAEAKSSFTVRYSTNFPTAARAAFDKALTIASANFESSVPIVVDATWTRLGPGVLGSARPTRFFTNFPNSPTNDLWYTSALANSIAGRDLDPTDSDIKANFSSSAPWSFATDGTAYRGYYDLVTVVLHEVVHGLGFLSNTYLSDTGVPTIQQATPFDAYVRPVGGTKSLADLQSGSSELARALVSPLEWFGAKGVAANGGTRPLLYSPQTYEAGSSTSHLDENVFGPTKDTLMTPRLDAAEVIHDIGPVTQGIFDDLRGTPQVTVITVAPTTPRNAAAVTGDRSAVITFDPPSNVRTSQVKEYSVEVVGGGVPAVTGAASPITVTGLKPGTYVFQVTATNEVGTSAPAFTNSIRVTDVWKASTIDGTANGTNVASTTWRGQTVIAYGDGNNGVLKLGIWNGKKWTVSTVDGNSSKGGRTTHDVSGKVSLCVSGTGPKALLHIFYADVTERDLRYARYDGKTYTFSVVDGDAATGQEVEDPKRVRTNSDVAVSNACAVTPAGVQAFYRDETLGILLGAVLVLKGKTINWRYELIDGDRDVDGRTTGDVGFRLQATTLGSTVYLAYDAVRTIDASRAPLTGDVRYAVRKGAAANSWTYFDLELSSDAYPVAGYDVAVAASAGRVYGAWIAASATDEPTPEPDTLKIAELRTTGPRLIRSVLPTGFGNPAAPLAIDGSSVAYGCSERICAVEIVDGSRTLISGASVSPDATTTWLQPVAAGRKGARGLLIGLAGALSLVRP
jgi:hypothetical protein